MIKGITFLMIKLRFLIKLNPKYKTIYQIKFYLKLNRFHKSKQILKILIPI
jgi:hypothetical protein